MVAEKGTCGLDVTGFLEGAGFDKMFGASLQAAVDGFGVCEVPSDHDELILCCVRCCYEDFMNDAVVR